MDFTFLNDILYLFGGGIVEKYIILEVIPDGSSKEKGQIVQLSALKIENLKLLDRFDYRLEEESIRNKEVLKFIQYDKDDFTYVASSENIINDFKTFSEGYLLLIIDNSYTKSFLEELPNEKRSVFSYLNMRCSDFEISDMIEKYHLRPSNHIVDLLYEAYIAESNQHDL